NALCPNLSTTATSLIGARLISHAGSLKRLAELPSSTVQVLGAEKSLFRHLKTGSKPPRFGVLFQHPLVAEAAENLKGKTARKLASKISIAVKQDYFRGRQ
ncbi:ATP-binding protein, partial [Candidatus Woesearchaeota archaeon]|nr:ATP-binding protein [Candidatus Woesearchaeota archaeon]